MEYHRFVVTPVGCAKVRFYATENRLSYSIDSHGVAQLSLLGKLHQHLQHSLGVDWGFSATTISADHRQVIATRDLCRATQRGAVWSTSVHRAGLAICGRQLVPASAQAGYNQKSSSR